jgi:hypothetical protein
MGNDPDPSLDGPGGGVEFVPAIKIVETAPGGNAVIL